MSSSIIKSGVTLKAKKVDLNTQKVKSIVRNIQAKQEKIIDRKQLDSKKMDRIISI